MAAYAYYGDYVQKWKDTDFIKNVIKAKGDWEALPKQGKQAVIGVLESNTDERLTRGDATTIASDATIPKGKAIYFYGTREKLAAALAEFLRRQRVSYEERFEPRFAAEEGVDEKVKSAGAGRLVLFHGLVKAGTFGQKKKAIIVLAAVRRDSIEECCAATKLANNGVQQDKIGNRGYDSYFITGGELSYIVSRIPK